MTYPQHSYAVEIEEYLKTVVSVTNRAKIDHLADLIESSPYETLRKFSEMIEDPYVRDDFQLALDEALNLVNGENLLQAIAEHVKAKRKMRNS